MIYFNVGKCDFFERWQIRIIVLNVIKTLADVISWAENGNLSSSTFVVQLIFKRVVPNCEFVLAPLKYFKC